MSEVSIFSESTAVQTTRREPTALGKTLAANGMNRRIQTNVNGTFRRMINGEQIGEAIRGEIDVIVIGALPSVSRVFYKAKYDPNATPTLPDCWSNLGERPEQQAANKQATSCIMCPQNVKGSGDNGGRACRYQRRVAVLVPGDTQGDIYQLNIPAKSLFGKPKGGQTTLPFEAYSKFLLANNYSPDNVVTKVAYNLNADTMELNFKAIRPITDEEFAQVVKAQEHPDCGRYSVITVAQASNVEAQPGETQAQLPAQTMPEPSADDSDDNGEPPAATPAVRQGRKTASVGTPLAQKL